MSMDDSARQCQEKGKIMKNQCAVHFLIFIFRREENIYFGIHKSRLNSKRQGTKAACNDDDGLYILIIAIHDGSSLVHTKYNSVHRYDLLCAHVPNSHVFPASQGPNGSIH